MSLTTTRISGWICGLLMVTAGCSATNEVDYGKVDLIQAGGTVTLDGAPLASAVISFDNPETGTFSFARTDSGGKYVLQFDTEKKGVTPGQKIVQISTSRTILGLGGSEEGDPASDGAVEGEGESGESNVEAVPSCYNKESILKVEVTKDKTTYNFDLKSDCSTTGASN
ncbi:MAG: carboxypeptidase regulatory-like domain-containing protein [Planctomyces sp.]|nr:carboxypeptidase regulatory-like domain-containing protein [Planctomyces sp.]